MSDSPLKFAGRVVIVTGAGGGLGRTYALAFAERGASVVVNDLGGDIKGDGKNAKAADLVVNEIRAKNGIAVANYDSVENAENIIKTAIDAFGRIDVLVNNAGILRDKSFLRTSDLDWDLIHRIHLRASFLLTRAAWPHMQKNKFGRVIMTSSAAGIYGNFGQSNYSAAKLGLFGLSNTLSLEGAKYNIKCNTIAPLAKSRLTETVMPEELLANLKPEYVAPLVLYLCHESSEETGSLFEVGAGWVGKLRWQKSSGKYLLKDNKPFTPEDIRDSWNEITSFTKPIYHSAIGESTNYALSMSEGGAKNDTDDTQATNQQRFSYEQKETILYALSLNFTTAGDLKFLYENHPEFSVFPTFGIVAAQDAVFGSINNFELPKGVNLDPTRLLHGEHYFELLKPLPTSASLRREVKLVDCLDKGSGAALILNVDSFDEKNEKISFNQFVVFLVGSGGFGGKKDSSNLHKVSTKKFDRAPDHTMQERTNLDQAALYRLNGDYNPLHIDPEFASMGGFSQPILHGLCSFGIAIKHILKMYCDNDVKCFKSVKARFNKPVLPGQTIKTNTWLEKENNLYRVYFDCKTIENDSPIITGGYVDLFNIKQDTKAAVKTTQPVSSSEFQSVAVFETIKEKLAQNPDLADKIKAVYVFSVKKGDETKTWTVDLKSKSIYEGEAKEGVKADCTLTVSDEDFVGLATGKSNAQQMFMKGKLKIKGNVMIAQKLGTLFKENAKL